MSGAPVASTIGVTTARPIASEPTSTDSSPTRRTATASGTSGMPQQQAERRPSSTVTRLRPASLTARSLARRRMAFVQNTSRRRHHIVAVVALGDCRLAAPVARRPSGGAMLRFRPPSPAMCVALLGLSVGLGGTAWAAVSLPAHSVGTAQLKHAAVTGDKVKDHSLTGDDIRLTTLGPFPPRDTRRTPTSRRARRAPTQRRTRPPPTRPAPRTRRTSRPASRCPSSRPPWRRCTSRPAATR